MACFDPLKMFRSAELNDNGKRNLTCNPLKALNSHVVTRLPCNNCDGCRTDRRKQLALRVVHECQMHEFNYFVTLTQTMELRPVSNSLSKRDLQLFNKRLRSHYGIGGEGRKMSFLGCGEYGKHGDNPHYHEILMSDVPLFTDGKLWRKDPTGPVFKSGQLEELWGKGLCEVTSTSYATAAYVAGYTLKKLLSADDPSLVRVSPVDGGLHTVEPEFALMSRRPGLGSRWFEVYESECFPCDFLIAGSKRSKVKPPRFYLNKLKERVVEHARPGFMQREVTAATPILDARRAHGHSAQARANSTPERLKVRAELMRLNLQRSRRSL